MTEGMFIFTYYSAQVAHFCRYVIWKCILLAVRNTKKNWRILSKYRLLRNV